MDGFYTWDDVKTATGNCPNCGAYVGKGSNERTMHFCDDDDIVSHHIKQLDAEFRTCYGITRTPARLTFGKHDSGPLERWKAFEDWTETSEGRFSVYCAERQRLHDAA